MRQDRRHVPGKLAELRPRSLVPAPLRRAARIPLLRLFIADPEGLRRGIAVDIVYSLFRGITGVIYGSVWFISLAVYHLGLALFRARLAVKRRHERNGVVSEDGVYIGTALMLFALDIPMGGTIYLMARTDAGFSYPGYVIYISAIYTFWSVGTAIYGYVKAAWNRKSKNDDPTGVSLKALNAARAAVSVLGLQTAMLTSFAGGDDEYTRMMNTITGGFVFAAVIFIAAHTMKKALRGKAGKE